MYIKMGKGTFAELQKTHCFSTSYVFMYEDNASMVVYIMGPEMENRIILNGWKYPSVHLIVS